MNKYLHWAIVLAVLFTPFQSVFAQKNDSFYIQKKETNDEYQGYLGKTLVFYAPQDDNQRLFKLEDIELGVPYEIAKMSLYYSLGLPTVDFGVKKAGDNGGKMIHVKCLNGEAKGKRPGLEDIPAYWYAPINAIKESNLGRIVDVSGIRYTVTEIDASLKGVPFVFSDGEGATFSESLFNVFDFELKDNLYVEKPIDESILYGKSTVNVDHGAVTYTYTDNLISIVFYGTLFGFDFALKNLSDNTIKIIWDDAACVDAFGTTSNVMHGGVKYYDKEKSQTPSIVVKGAMINDVAVSVDNVEWNGREWQKEPIYSPKSREWSISLLLPLQVRGVTHEYIFTFTRTCIWKYPELQWILTI